MPMDKPIKRKLILPLYYKIKKDGLQDLPCIFAKKVIMLPLKLILWGLLQLPEFRLNSIMQYKRTTVIQNYFYI